MKGRRLSARVVEFRSGRESVGTGFCFLLLEDEFVFLGHVRWRWCSAPAVAVEVERRWSQPGSEGLHTGQPGRRPGSS